MIFVQMNGNRICRQIEWYEDDSKIEAWRTGKTGFPWIDACMRQMVSVITHRTRKFDQNFPF